MTLIRIFGPVLSFAIQGKNSKQAKYKMDQGCIDTQTPAHCPTKGCNLLTHMTVFTLSVLVRG